MVHMEKSSANKNCSAYKKFGPEEISTEGECTTITTIPLLQNTVNCFSRIQKCLKNTSLLLPLTVHFIPL